MTEPEQQTERRRRIRSFVRREGRFTPAQRRAFETLWPRFGLEPGKPVGDLRLLFPGCGRFVLEIGFGMGQALLELATREPQTGFLGIEVHRPGVGSLLAAADALELSNVRVWCADAAEVLESAIGEASLDAILVFFPDPWPKKRHHKRRLIQPAFAALLANRLKPQGSLHLATDWQDYALQMLEVLDATPGLVNVAGAGRFAARPASRPLTRFEDRGIRLGHEVRDLLFRRELR